MDQIFLLLILALVLEAVHETLKLMWKDKKFNLDVGLALALGLLAAFAGKLDVLEMFGVSLAGVPYLGIILTGILLSRGANFIHDLYRRIESLKDENLTMWHPEG